MNEKMLDIQNEYLSLHPFDGQQALAEMKNDQKKSILDLPPTPESLKAIAQMFYTHQELRAFAYPDLGRYSHQDRRMLSGVYNHRVLVNVLNALFDLWIETHKANFAKTSDWRDAAAMMFVHQQAARYKTHQAGKGRPNFIQDALDLILTNQN